MDEKRSNFFVQKLMLRISGISLRENESNAYKIFSLVFLGFICAYPFLALLDVFRQDFETGANLLKYEFMVISAIVKIVCVRFKRNILGKLLDKLEPGSSLENFRRTFNKEEELIKQGKFIANAQLYAYCFLSFGSYTFNFFYCLWKRFSSKDYHDWQFMYGSYNLINATYSPNFEILWGYQSFCCFFLGIDFVMIDATMGAILCYICFELKILQSNLRWIVDSKAKSKEKDLKPSVLNNIKKNPEWNYLHKSLKQSVEYHLSIIDIIHDLNETFSTLLLITLLGTLGMFTLLVYKASMFPINDIRMVVSLIEVLIVTMQVLIFCFWSDEMMLEGEKVGRAAYEANFVGTDVRLQKGLILIIRRSQKPLTLSAGKFVDIRLSTFVWIVRSAYSVFTVLRTRNLEN